MTTFTVKNKETIFKNYFQIDKYTFDFPLFNGETSNTIQREVFERGQSAAVLPYDPITKQFALIYQFRIGALAANLYPWVLEPIAGIVGSQENPRETVRREAKEEAGIDIKELYSIGEFLASPGGTSEVCHMYVGICDLIGRKTGEVFGLKEEDEDIKLHVYSLRQLPNVISFVNNASTMIVLQWLEINKDKMGL